MFRVYLSSEELAEKRKEQGQWSFNGQTLMRPQGDPAHEFSRAWLKYCHRPEGYKPNRDG